MIIVCIYSWWWPAVLPVCFSTSFLHMVFFHLIVWKGLYNLHIIIVSLKKNKIPSHSINGTDVNTNIQLLPPTLMEICQQMDTIASVHVGTQFGLSEIQNPRVFYSYGGKSITRHLFQYVIVKLHQVSLSQDMKTTLNYNYHFLFIIQLNLVTESGVWHIKG